MLTGCAALEAVGGIARRPTMKIAREGRNGMATSGSSSGHADLPPWERDTKNHPVVKQVVKLIAADLYKRIAAGRYSFGTRLPAERELADEFGQSRTAVRQALDFLEGYKVIARRAGSGAFVNLRVETPAPVAAADDPGIINVASIAEAISPFEMNVAQSIIEPEIARLATISMSIRDLAKLRAVIDEIDGIVTDAARFADLEKQFMMTLCQGTRNIALISMYRVLNEVRRQPSWCADKKRTLTPDRIRQTQHALRSLYSALERRNVDNAVEFMRLYIASSQEDMIYVAQ